MISDRVHQILEKIQFYLKNKPNYQGLCETEKINPPKVMAVSKRFGCEDILKAYQAGLVDFGENYLQEAIEKIDDLRTQAPDVCYKMVWHYIGQAQSNKCKYLVKYFDWVQTVDSIDFADKLNREMGKYLEKQNLLSEKPLPQTKRLAINICIQVNIDNSPTKNGVACDEVLEIAEYIQKNCPYLKLRGIMAIPDYIDDQILRQHYQKAYLTYAQLQKTQGQMIDTLSIGMSQDMQIAIEEGSTMLRIGQAIFGPRV
jgi:PLP dependent protein